MNCWLIELGNCAGPIEHHHIINRSKTRGNKKARKYLDKFVAPVCHYHNVSRIADTKRAQKILIRKLEQTGVNVRQIINGIPWKVKHKELSYEGIMGENHAEGGI